MRSNRKVDLFFTGISVYQGALGLLSKNWILFLLENRFLLFI